MYYDERATKLANKIEKHYEHHGVQIEIMSYKIIGNGERFIYVVKLLKGTRQSPFFNRAKDIQLALKLPLFYPYKEGLSICIAVSEEEAVENSLLKIIKSPVFNKSNLQIPYAYGYALSGKECVLDLATLPHLLIGGSTNSGKSVALRCLITSVIIKRKADRVNLLLFDTGASDLAVFSEIPHLSHPIIKDADTGIKVMIALVNEMERRISLEQNELRKLPAIVCIVDEFVSFISNINKKDSKLLTDAISNLLRRGRHARIHMVLATQDPTKENMKVDLGNITARMAFACAKPQHSVTILGVGGAEKLTARGAMLLKSREHPDPQYIQGSFIKPNDIKLLLNLIPKSYDCPLKFEINESNISLVDSEEKNTLMSPAIVPRLDKDDELFAKIIIWSLERDSISCKLIEDTFRLGYRRANKFLERMRELNIAGDMYAKLPRAVLPSNFEDLSSETINLLNLNGYAEADIADVFKAKRQAFDNPIDKSTIVPIENNASHNETKADDNITMRTSTLPEKLETRLNKKNHRKNSNNPQRKRLIKLPHNLINELSKLCETR